MVKTILFIQHANNLGGSAISLFYTIEGLLTKPESKKYRFILLLYRYNKEVHNLYEKLGIEIIYIEEFYTYEYSEAFYNKLYSINGLMRELQQIYLCVRQHKKLKEVIKTINPDIVHINSSVLTPVILAVRELKIKIIWHIREAAPNPFIGLRKYLFGKIFKIVSHSVFISNSNKKSWNASKNSTVIYNFIPPTLIDIKQHKDVFAIIFLGGVAKIKGGQVLLKSLLNGINKGYKIEQTVVYYLGGVYSEPDSKIYRFFKKINDFKPSQSILPNSLLVTSLIRRINEKKSNIKIIPLAFQKNIIPYLEKSHVLCFPAIRPHFSRPILEAGFASIPVIANSIEGMDEQILQNKTGFIIDFNDSKSLFSILSKLQDEKINKRMGSNNLTFTKEKYGYQNSLNSFSKILYDK